MQDRRELHRPPRIARRLGRWWLAPVAVLLCTGPAHAQTSPACEQFKGVLAKRISGTYTLEDVPADAPIPPGAKAVATCEAGARKILLIRPGREGDPAAPVAASAATTTTAIAPVAPASAPAPRPRPAEVRAATPPPAAERVQATPPVASAIELPRPFEGAPAATQSPSPDDDARPAGTSLRERATDWVGRRWPWLLAPLLLLLALASWAWWSHRRAYDEAGLPRGPRLN